MELVTELINNNQLILCVPVAFVVVVGVLLFTFGFKTAEQPPFDKLTIDDRKPSNKKRKIKEKKTVANGHISSGDTKGEKSPAKETKRSPAKEPEQKPKDKKSDNKTLEKAKKNEVNKTKNLEEVKIKKTKKVVNEKPADFDEGDWEKVPSKADKKKKQDSPAKKDKKEKKEKQVEIEKSGEIEKSAEIEKYVKEVVNQELKEQEKEVRVEKPVEQKDIVVVEEKKEKKKEKKAKKEVVEAPAVEVKEVEVLEEAKAVEIPIKEPPVEIPTKQPVVEKDVKQNSPKAQASEPASSGVAFDELGDTWTEAKAAKKSKKKARRDN